MVGRLKSFGVAESAAAVAAVLVLLIGVVVVRSESPINAAMRLTDGSVWLRSTTHGVITLHDSGDGAAVTDLAVAGAGEQFTVGQAGSDAVVVNQTTGGVSVVSGTDWTVGPTYRLGNENDPDLGAVVGLDGAWLVQHTSVAPLDLATLQPGASFPRGAAIHDASVTADGRLVVSSGDADGPLAVYDPATGESRQVAEISGPAEVFRVGEDVVAIEVEARSVWIEGRGVVCDELRIPAGAELAAEGGEELAVVVSDTGSAFLWNPTEGCPADRAFTQLPAGDYGRPVLTEGWGVIPDHAAAEVYVINVPDRRIEVDRPINLPGIGGGTEFDLVAENGSVWFNDPSTAAAGLIAPDGTITAFEKYRTSPDGEIITPGEGEAGGGGPGSGSEDPDEGEDGSATSTTAPADADEDAATTTTAASADQEAGSTTTAASPTTVDTLEPANNERTASTDTPSTTPTTEGGGSTTETTEGTTPPVTGDPNPGTDRTVQITASPPNPEVGETITLDAVTEDGADSFQWTLRPDPGVRLDRQRISVVYDQPGTVTASVEVCSDGECVTDTAAFEVFAPDTPTPPVAIIAAGPRTLEVDEPLTLRDASTDASERSWTIEGGTPSSSTNASPTVRWAQPGTYTVTLEVWNDDGVRDSVITTVRVEASVEVPTDLQLNCSPSSIQTDDTGTCSVPTSVRDALDSLTFEVRGQGTELGEDRSSVQFRANGQGTITVTAIANGGAVTDEASVQVTAPSAPEVTIGGNASREVDQSGTYRVNSTGGQITSYSWSATGSPSAHNSNQATYSPTWSTPGTYEVRVTVTGPGGTDTARLDVTVTDRTSPPPTANKTYYMQTNHQSWFRRSVLQFSNQGAVSARLVSGETYGGFYQDGDFEHVRQQPGSYNFTFTFDELDASGTIVGRTTILFKAEGQEQCNPNEPTLAPSSFSIGPVTETTATIQWTTNTPAGVQSIAVTGGGRTLSDSSPTEHSTVFEFIPGEARYTGTNTLSPGTQYTVTATMVSPCGATASVPAGSFTTPGTPGGGGGPVDTLPLAPSNLSCEYRNVQDDGTWQERWTWTDNSVGDTGYDFYDWNGAVIAGSEFHAQTMVLTNRTSVGLRTIRNTGPAGSTDVTTSCPAAGGGAYPVSPPSSDTTPPSSDTTPPSSDTTPPSSDTTPPSSDTTPPSSDTTPPSSDTTPPSSDTTPPSSDTTPPSSDP